MIVANNQCGTIRIAGGKRETALTVNRDVIAQDQFPTALNPMKEHAGMHVPSTPGTESLEERLTEEDPGDEIVDRTGHQESGHWGER